MSAGAAVSMAALCVSEPLTLMSGSKGSGGGSTAHSSLSCSLSLFLALSLLSRSLSLCHTHTPPEQRGRCPTVPRTDSAWDLQPLCLERMGGARAGVGWTSSNLSRYSPDLGGEKVFPTLETKISSLFFLIFQEEKGFSLNFLFVD